MSCCTHRRSAWCSARPADWQRHYCGEVLPRKLALDRAYLERRTVWADLRLILRTLAVMWD
jgi:lipopolysaccharide/colanic/teichoic acid biosynthesis glycosyltransferase